MENVVPLAVNVQVFTWLHLWPKENEVSPFYALKTFLFHLQVYFSIYAVAAAAVRQFIVGVDDSSALVEGVIATIGSLGFIYMTICLFYNMATIKSVVSGIAGFTKYCPEDVIIETELKIRKYSKVIFAYTFLGNAINAALAFYGARTCERPSQILYERDPCGYPARCYYPLDISKPPLYFILFLQQSYSCFIISMGVMSVTMLIVGILVHTIAQLKYCAKIITDCKLEKHAIRNIVKYHATIIGYSEVTNVAFGNVMIFHLTVTSLVISVLAFNIVIVENVTDCLRFGLHLGGWLVLVFLICYYGQQLNDESTNIATAAYSVQWFDAPVSVQRDLRLIIARAQRPLALTAMNLDVMSFQTFVKVMRTAYSYFALFLNLKF